MEWNEWIQEPLTNILMSLDPSTQLENYFDEESMPYGRGTKRRRVANTGKELYRKRSLAVPRGLGIPKDNRCIIPLTQRITFPLTADVRSYFCFDTDNIYVFGVGAGTYPMPGGTDLVSVFSMARVHKVELTIMGSANDLPFTADSGLNIPHCYTGFDPNASDVKTATEMFQLSSLKVSQLDKPIRRTFYPRLEGGNGVIDIGTNRRNLFEKMGSTSTQRWRGIQFMTDNVSTNYVNATVSVVFKVYYECMGSV